MKVQAAMTLKLTIEELEKLAGCKIAALKEVRLAQTRIQVAGSEIAVDGGIEITALVELPKLTIELPPAAGPSAPVS